MKHNIIWKTDTSKYASGKVAFSGKVRIGGYSWNAISKSPKYRASSAYGDFISANGAETEEECRELVEKAFEKFINALSLPEHSLYYEMKATLQKISDMCDNSGAEQGGMITSPKFLNKLVKEALAKTEQK